MSWQETFVRVFGPGIQCGTDLPAYFRQLNDNRYRVHPLRANRLMAGFQHSVITSLKQRAEKRQFGDEWNGTRVSDPLIILGHWRSGTTHLHNLLAMDERFSTPNLYQVMYPHIFLTTEERSSRIMARFLPETRVGLDNMPLRWDVPYEDEFAMAADGLSVFLGWAWPQRHNFYDRFMSMNDVSDDETMAWKQSWMTFLKKLTLKYQKPLILKSPPHTARIKLILELFPNARFVHVHRNPYEVFSSRQRLDSVALRGWEMHSSKSIDWNERILRLYTEMHTALFEQLPLVPAGHYHEVRFEDLELDPLQVLRTIYDSLSLPSFREVESTLREYIDSIADYRKNRHPNIPAEWKRRVDNEWGQFFEHWGYDFA